MKLNLIVGHSVFSATMYENRSAEEFSLLLPITLTLADDNNAGKSGRLPRRLPVDEPEEGVTVSAGDFSYYTPFRNLCIHCQDSGLSFCQIPLGKIEDKAIDTIRKMCGSGPVEVTFEVA